MPIFSSALRLLTALQSRFRRSRPGSVLVLVIVLLLLLSILGAAYLSTTHSDRLNSQQTQINVQVDLLAQGLASAIQGVILDDLNDTGGNFRNTSNVPGIPASPAPQYTFDSRYQGSYEPTRTYSYGDIVSDTPVNSPSDPSAPYKFYTFIGSAPAAVPLSTVASWQQTTRIGSAIPIGTPWLASRLPDIDSNNLPAWPHLTQAFPNSAQVLTNPLIGNTPVSVMGLPFESPDGTTPFPSFTPGLVNSPAYINVEPGFKSIPAGGPLIPVLTIDPAAVPVPAPPGLIKKTVIAGDADGDGIADSFLFRIPGAFQDGLTWYAGVRIIDNNSAINANTAWSRDNDYNFTNTAIANWGFFPTNVGLTELLWPTKAPAETTALNQYRFNVAPPGVPLASATPQDDAVLTPPASMGARTDFTYITQGDAFYHQFIQRMAHPGLNTPPQRYQGLSLGEQASLARHFLLADPLGGSAQSVLETMLPTELYTTGVTRTTPYNGISGNDVKQWWVDNFSFVPYPQISGYVAAGPTAPTSAITRPLRSMLVTHNPVNNYIKPVYDPYNPGEPINPFMLPYGIGDQYQGNTPPPVPAVYLYNHYKGIFNAATTYQINDIVLFYPNNPPASNVPSIPGPGLTFICVQAAPAVAPCTLAAGVYTFNASWQLQPWSPRPTKTNVNTATFRELFRAFWCVMAGNPSQVTGAPNGMMEVSPFSPRVNNPDNTLNFDPTTTRLHMFRSPLRDVTNTSKIALMNTLPPGSMTQLRAAIAAVNTLGLRNQSQDVISRTIPLQAYLNGTPPIGGGPAAPIWNVEARVYSATPQPFITEVYADNNLIGNDPANPGFVAKNAGGYVAIELYNPYSQPLTLNDWQIGIVNRNNPGSSYPTLSFQVLPSGHYFGPMIPVAPPPATTGKDQPGPQIVIPAHGFALLENYNADPSPPAGVVPDPNDALYRPQSSGFPHATGALYQAGDSPGTNAYLQNIVDIYVPGLGNVMPQNTAIPGQIVGGEFTLLRHRRWDGTYTKIAGPFVPATPAVAGSTVAPGPAPSGGPTDLYDEGSAALPHLADFVPIDSFDFAGMPQGSTVYPAPIVRWSYIRTKGAGNDFLATYPGSYQANTVPRIPSGVIQSGYLIPTAAAFTPPGWPALTMPVFGQNGKATYLNRFPPIQIYNTGMPGPNPMVTPTAPAGSPPPQKFPFGAFARDGDMLDIPYIGAYRIRPIILNGDYTGAATDFLELNSLPMDCSFAATITTPANDAFENVGRFCPLMSASAGKSTVPSDYYGWARNLFNYLTVESNSDSYTPNVDPGINDNYVTAAPAEPLPKYYPSTAGTPPTQTFAGDRTATDQLNQDTLGVEGKINISTAPAATLAQLPMIPAASDPGRILNNQLAADIVAYRELHGPFTSIFDLNLVTDAAGLLVFQNGKKAAPPTDSDWGLLHPPDAAFPNSSTKAAGITPPDYQQQFAIFNRISNLITTRSDTFTVYIVVEGWQNAVVPGITPPPGTKPVLRAVRRFAFIADRSAVNQDDVLVGSPTPVLTHHLNSNFFKTLVFPND